MTGREPDLNFGLTRREAMGSMAALLGGGLALNPERRAQAALSPAVKKAVKKGLDWVSEAQSRLGHWQASNSYRIPMTALAGIALLSQGSTTKQGTYAANVRRGAEYILRQCRPNGLIGVINDHRYTYGHGYSMLFLSQVLEKEKDDDRRKRLKDVLTRAVKFSAEAQTKAGGWGYVSAKDGNDFDEGSITVTQVQGLHGCKNAGIKVPKAIIDRAVKYIYQCQMTDGGICYSARSRSSSRPAISAAALAALFNAGEFEGAKVKRLIAYCKNKHSNPDGGNRFGHWHYTYYYYAQAMYRMGGKNWEEFRDQLDRRILGEQTANGSWTGYIGPIFVTALNLTMLQLENARLPFFKK